MTAKRGPGRPSTFDQALFDAICERVAQGIPLAQICRDEGMPNRRTINTWRHLTPELTAQMQQARDDGYEALAEGCLEIADDARNDWMERNGALKPNEEAIGRSKLRVWTRLQLLARWDPKKYAEVKAIGGTDRLDPIRMQATEMSDDDLADIASGRG